MASKMLSKALGARGGIRPLRVRSMSTGAPAAATQAAAGGEMTKASSGPDNQVQQQQQSDQQQRRLARTWDNFGFPMPTGLFDLWSPVSSSRSVRQMLDTMNRLLDVDIFPSSQGGMMQQQQQQQQPSFRSWSPWDIIDKEDAYHLRIDMPGFEKSDVNIRVEDENEMVIQAERKGESDVFGIQRRVHTRMLLPQEAMKEEIKAELKNGVLTIVVPKAKVPEDKRVVEVNVE